MLLFAMNVPWQCIHVGGRHLSVGIFQVAAETLTLPGVGATGIRDFNYLRRNFSKGLHFGTEYLPERFEWKGLF